MSKNIRAIEQQLNHQITGGEIDQNFMDNISSQLSNIFLDSACASFKTATSNKRSDKRNKPWFGSACKVHAGNIIMQRKNSIYIARIQIEGIY